ncbi:hypothetical protein F511_12827 [Dorcoceras hygrometricum]|uniref:Uncharacterized protein n=1 Tax=Dorcoceras hygrometricum TaxID=472368 RepID=A0A2Z7CR12_9LAMI|nr:hypothetical protein F511_12827 [Dorcoceras hygrometricum]
MLTSSMLITASSNRNADVIIANHSLLSADNADVTVSDSSSSLLLNNLVNIADYNFFQSAMLTSSLLITASSNRNADVIIADHRLLSADNADVTVSDSSSSLLLNNLVNSNLMYLQQLRQQ